MSNRTGWGMTKNLFISAIGCLLLLSFLGCQTTTTSTDDWLQSDKIRVLSTTTLVDDLVREVGGEHVARLTLIAPALDPHSYELVKGDDEKIFAAHLIFYSGLGLEHGPNLHRFLRESEIAWSVGDAIIKDRPEAIVRIDGQIDPHIWMDVSLWLQGLDVVAEALEGLDPEHGAEYWERAAMYKKRLLALDAKIASMLDQVPLEKRYLVTSHDACNYFCRRYLATSEERLEGVWMERCSSPEGLAPDAQMSLRDLQKVVHELLTHKIDVIFPESNLSQDSLRKLIDIGKSSGLSIRIALEPLYADAMGEAGSNGDTYEKMMEHNARVLKENLCG
ncbi:MAG: zinc ABC transporter substrate-binding protein [Verrucomicrobia bacterium]|nr:zinc ABC transporter substrate-binding protein [Verrucomicrobiota bacterium]